MAAHVRAELHELYSGDKVDYNTFYAEMSKYGWSRFRLLGGSLEELSTGLYYHSKGGSKEMLLLTVQAAALRTGHKASIYVMQGDDAAGSGLKLLSTPPRTLTPLASPTVPMSAPESGFTRLMSLTHPLATMSVPSMGSTVPMPRFSSLLPATPSVPGMTPSGFYGTLGMSKEPKFDALNALTSLYSAAPKK